MRTITLPPDGGVALLAMHDDGKSPEDIAAALDMPLPTVRDVLAHYGRIKPPVLDKAHSDPLHDLARDLRGRTMLARLTHREVIEVLKRLPDFGFILPPPKVSA
jgi:hypothetical protein